MARFSQDNEPFSLAVVIPNRNDSKYLSVCIRSVVEQSVKPDEFLIIDDESTDDSVDVIRRGFQGHPFARLDINPRNLGGVQTAQLGLTRVTSKFVLFLGANDLILPGHFARLKACLERFPQAGLWSAMVWMIDDKDRYLHMHPSAVVALRDAYFPPEECRRMMRNLGNWLTGQTTVYRREALLEAGGFDPTLKGLNDLLAAQVVASRYGAAFSPAPVGVMRIHEGAFLPETLKNSAQLESIVRDLRARGPKVEPALFTPSLLDRTEQRFDFASLRLSEGATLDHVAAKYGGWRSAALKMTRLVPRALGGLRTALYFAIMRPFDLLPTLWYRLLGSALVLLNERLRGRIPG